MKIFVRSKSQYLPVFEELAEKHQVGIEVALSFTDIYDTKLADNLKSKNVTLHAPFFDVNIVSFNQFVSTKSMEIMRDTIIFCNEVLPFNVVFHHNYHPFLYNFEEDFYAEVFSERFLEILEHKKGEYLVSIENVFENNANIGRKILDRLNNDFTGFCFDYGHFNLFTEITLDDWITSWMGKIWELHLHNNFGYRDDHNSLEYGNLRIDDLLKRCKPRCYTIENRNTNDTERSIVYLKKLLCQ
ncbi:MAG: TIM barrel protein [Calditerrivibrio sp.]|nr:TIM barrel protein [Calditerrivibrio sp.]